MRLIAILAVAGLTGLGACSGSDDAANNQSATKAGFRQAKIGTVGLEYETAKLVVTSVTIPLPYDAEREIRGMKLIAAAREPMLDQPNCPDQEASICRAEAEGGLTMTVMNQPYAELSGMVRNTRPATFAGRQGVTWTGRLGGKPATYTAIPVEQQTMLAIRQTEGEGAPDPAAIDAVIASLVFNPPEAPAPAEK